MAVLETCSQLAAFNTALVLFQVEFFRSVGLPYAPLPDADVDAIRDQLAAVEAAHGNLDGRNELRRGDTKTIFQVPFTAVPDLIATRKVLLKGGFAYVGREQVKPDISSMHQRS